MVRIGQKLREERLRRKLTLDDVSKAIKIRPSFLSAIERGDYYSLPSAAYAQGFVSNYAAYLGLSKRESLALFRREFDEEKMLRVLPKGFAKEEYRLQGMRVHQMVLVGIAIGLFIAGFIVFQYRGAFLPPALEVVSPKEGVTVGQDLTVTGKTDPDAVVSVNNELVSVDDYGQFLKHIVLFPGKSLIEIKAKNRFGKEAVVDRHITVQ